MDLLENTQAVKKRWGIVFYGIKSKLIAYYIFELKEPTSSSTLDALGNFISEHGIPIMIINDRDGVLGTGKKWKHYLRKSFTPLQPYEPDKHNHNPVKRAIQKFKAGLSKIRNDCGTGALEYHCEAMDYLCDINNCVARVSLGNRLPFEAFGGEMPDISMIRFKVWDPV